jgi:urea transport system permease protein
MVIYAAVGGRMSLVGAVIGTLVVNAGKTLFSENFPELWLFLMAALFIGVTMAFPDGLAGLVNDKLLPWFSRRKSNAGAKALQTVAVAMTVPAATVTSTPMASHISVLSDTAYGLKDVKVPAH